MNIFTRIYIAGALLLICSSLYAQTGINTTTPQATLHVKDKTGSTQTLKIENSTGGTTLSVFPNGNVGINNNTPASVLDISSTTSGLLVPRMTTVQRDALVLPPKGTFIYNTTTDRHEVNVGTDVSPVWNQYLTAVSGDQAGAIKSVSGSSGIISVTMSNLVYSIDISAGYFPKVASTTGSKSLISFEEQRWGALQNDGFQLNKAFGSGLVVSDLGAQSSGPASHSSTFQMVNSVPKTATTTAVYLCSGNDDIGSSNEINSFLVINTTDNTIDEVKMFRLPSGEAVIVVKKLQ